MEKEINDKYNALIEEENKRFKRIMLGFGTLVVSSNLLMILTGNMDSLQDVALVSNGALACVGLEELYSHKCIKKKLEKKKTSELSKYIKIGENTDKEYKKEITLETNDELSFYDSNKQKVLIKK